MKTEDPLTRCEPLTALAILRGDLAPPCPAEDAHPFVPLVAYVRERCQRWTAPVHAAVDANEDCHHDPALADAFAIAWRIALELRLPPPNIRHSLLNSTRIRIIHLRDYCLKLDGEHDTRRWDVEGLEDFEKVLTDLIRLRQHCNIALAETGDRGALASLATDAEEQVRAKRLAYLPFAIGARSLLLGETLGCWREGEGPLGIVRTALALGTGILAQRERAAAGRAARDAAGGGELDDDRAGIVWLPERPAPVGLRAVEEAKPAAQAVAQPRTGTAVVFREDIHEAVGKGTNQAEVKKFLGDARGVALPLVPVPEDWDAWEAGLVAEAPWLAPFVRAVRTSQGGRTHWGGGVVCADGAPGAGKSRMCRRIAETSGLPFARFQCDASSDNSALSGSPIRWQSSHPGLVEQLLASSKTASGLVLVDEIEKAAGSRRNGGGDPLDIMHGLFEPETARAWKSPYLLAEIDLSHVLYLCTSNDTSSLPASLRDRMRIVKVSEPGPEHLGVLAPALAREACRELGLDERWGTLDSEEIGVLSEAWSGGSVRRLGRFVEALLLARDGAPVARH